MQKVIGYDRVSTQVKEDLEKDYDFTYFDDIDPKSDPQFLSALREAEGIIGLDLKVDGELLDHAPNLKIVSNVSTGYNNLNLAAMTQHHVMATNTPGVVEETTADLIFGLLLGAARRIPELDAYVKSGQWQQTLGEDSYGTNVHHKTLGIIGMGKIGSEIAKRAHWGFDMDILYHNRSHNRDAEQKYGAQFTAFDPLLQSADFVCLMTPLTAETKNLIGARELGLMKSSAIFINGSRGQTVDESALIEALENQKILAAGLDVFQTEPLAQNHPFLTLKNIVTIPHIGSSSAETELKMSELAAKDLKQGLAGKRPDHLLNCV